MTKADAAAGKCTFAHDGLGRRVADARDGLGTKHGYDRFGLASTTVLGRFRSEYRGVEDGKTVLLRDPTDRISRLREVEPGVFIRDLACGWSELSQYAVNGRCLAKVLYRTSNADERWERLYVYSAEGDLLERHDNARGLGRYAYDAAHRLTHVAYANGAVDEYEYDAGDNLVRAPGLSEGSLSGEHGGPSSAFGVDTSRGAMTSGNRIHRANGERFHYDARDHVALRERGTHQVHYTRDSADQLVGITAPGLTWSARYDALGRRVDKTVNGATTTYHWDDDRLVCESFADGRVRVYVYPDVRAIVPLLFVDYASVDAAPETGKAYYPIANHQGAIEAVLDATGAVVWRARLDPYGVAHVEVGADFHQPLRAPGRFHDAETGLDYNRFRYYDPALGRFLESDPIGIEGGANVYVPTANPLRDVDLRGLTTPPGGCTETDEEGAPPRRPPARPPGEGNDPPGTRRDADGRLRNDRGHFVTDPNASGSRTPDIRSQATRRGEGPPANSPRRDASPGPPPVSARPSTAEARAARDTAISERNAALARGDVDAANAAQGRANRQTEILGDQGTEAYMSQNHPDATRAYEGRGPGTFDGVYRTPGPPPGFIIAESKGGSSSLSSSRMVDGETPDTRLRAQQGTTEYRDSVIANMQNSDDPATRAMGDDLAAAALDGRVDYMMVQQPIDGSGAPAPTRGYGLSNAPAATP